MKNIKRTLITVLAMLLVCVLSVTATLAYITTKSDTVRNTFSVGNVAITLNEKDVDNDSNKDDNVTIGSETRDLANAYKLISGHTFEKDPTVFLTKGSEDAWIFVKIEVGVNLAKVLVANDTSKTNDGSIEDQLVANGWTKVADNFYGRQSKTTASSTVDVKHIVFSTITTKATATSDDLAACKGEEIAVTAYAIQADGLNTTTAAWNALNGDLKLIP